VLPRAPCLRHAKPLLASSSASSPRCMMLPRLACTQRWPPHLALLQRAGHQSRSLPSAPSIRAQSVHAGIGEA
jgi:hypothetical protein